MLEVVRTIVSVLLLLGLVIAVFQAFAALRISRVNALLRLLDEWNSRELHEAITYIHSLREEWKSSEPDQKRWNTLARKWVDEHISVDQNVPEGDQEERSKELYQRRLVSQFICRMGHLMRKRYLSPKDLFDVMPEVPRLLLVLSPIEKELAQYFAGIESSVEEWDRPFGKDYVFKAVLEQFQTWFASVGQDRLVDKEKA